VQRVCYHLTNTEIQVLKETSRQTGLSVAELIRRSIDAFLRMEFHQLPKEAFNPTMASGEQLPDRQENDPLSF
jgi:hypothetical protein